MDEQATPLERSTAEQYASWFRALADHVVMGNCAPAVG